MIGIFGNITAPDSIKLWTNKAGNNGDALFLFISNMLKLAGTIAGLYAVVQFIMAGYTYITAAGDTKMMERAWAMIWQSMLGLLIIGISFILAAVVGKLTGLDPLNPTIYGPQ